MSTFIWNWPYAVLYCPVSAATRSYPKCCQATAFTDTSPSGASGIFQTAKKFTRLNRAFTSCGQFLPAAVSISLVFGLESRRDLLIVTHRHRICIRTDRRQVLYNGNSLFYEQASKSSYIYVGRC